jgi:hypothetical protein
MTDMPETTEVIDSIPAVSTAIIYKKMMGS